MILFFSRKKGKKNHSFPRDAHMGVRVMFSSFIFYTTSGAIFTCSGWCDPPSLLPILNIFYFLLCTQATVEKRIPLCRW